MREPAAGCGSDGIDDPDAMGAAISAIVGVVEHGLFLKMASLALIAGDGAGVERRS